MPGAIPLNRRNLFSFDYIFHKDTHSSHGVRLFCLALVGHGTLLLAGFEQAI